MLLIDEINLFLHYNNRVIITGLDGSGKTTLISQLITKYTYIKCDHLVKTKINWNFLKNYQIIDRLPLFDEFVYNNWWIHSKELKSLLKSEVEKYLKNSLVIIKLDDLYIKNTDQPAHVIINRDIIFNNYVNLCFYLIECEVNLIIVSDNSVIKFNKNFNLNNVTTHLHKLAFLKNRRKKMKSLGIKDLIKAANDYYNGRPTDISDRDYDMLLSEEKSKNPKFNIFNHIIYEVDFEKAFHSIEFPTEERTELVLSNINFDKHEINTPKYDGCSIIAYYNKGVLTNILTRSDEETGVVQTKKLKNKVPNKVDNSINCILFEAVHEEGRPKANGLVNSKYYQNEVDADLELAPFNVMTDKPLAYIERMNLAGFVKNVDYLILSKDDIKSIKKTKKIKYKNKLYDIDGVVTYFNDSNSILIRKIYETEASKSKIINIEWSISEDTGIYHPIAIFDPIKIGNINISRAGLYNYQNLIEKQIGLGSEVEVILTKLTIPFIKSNTPSSKIPKPKCAYCNSNLEEFGVDLICSNIGCEFFEKSILYRISLYYEHPDKVDYIYQTSDLNYAYVKELISKKDNLLTILNKPAEVIFICNPPRLTDKKLTQFSKLKSGYEINLTDAFKNSCKIIIKSELLSDLQYEYMKFMYHRVERVIKTLDIRIPASKNPF